MEWNKAVSQPGSMEKFKRYLIKNLELAEERIYAVGMPNITQTFTIMDMHGWRAENQLRDACLSLWSHIGEIMQSHYPHQAYIIFIINSKIQIWTKISEPFATRGFYTKDLLP